MSESLPSVVVGASTKFSGATEVSQQSTVQCTGLHPRTTRADALGIEQRNIDVLVSQLPSNCATGDPGSKDPYFRGLRGFAALSF